MSGYVDSGHPIVYSLMGTRQCGYQQQAVNMVPLVYPCAALGAHTPTAYTTPVHVVQRCTKSCRAIISMCVSEDEETSAGEAPITGGVKQHVYADMSIRSTAHLEPTSTTAYGAGHQHSSATYSVHGDHPGSVHVVSPLFTSVPLWCCLARMHSFTSEHLSSCRVLSTSREGSLVLHQLALVHAGVSPVDLVPSACRPVLMACARTSSTGAHLIFQVLPVLKSVASSRSCAARFRSCAYQWPPRPAPPSPSRQ